MSITAQTLIPAKNASNSAVVEYTVQSGKTIIIDKFTATNITGGILTLSVWLIPQGGTADTSNQVVQTYSISGGVTKDFTELQNQILGVGEAIAIQASATTSIVVRVSGRVIS